MVSHIGCLQEIQRREFMNDDENFPALCHQIITKNKEEMLKLVDELNVLKIMLKDKTMRPSKKYNVFKEIDRVQLLINQIQGK